MCWEPSGHYYLSDFPDLPQKWWPIVDLQLGVFCVRGRLPGAIRLNFAPGPGKLQFRPG